MSEAAATGGGAAAPSGGSAPAQGQGGPAPSNPANKGFTVSGMKRASLSAAPVTPVAATLAEKVSGSEAKPRIPGDPAKAAPDAAKTVADLPRDGVTGQQPDKPAGAAPDVLEQAPANDNADPFDRELHGVKLKELVEALERGDVPDALLDALGREIPDGEGKRRITLKEALDGNLRLSDYSRRLSQLDVQHKQFQAERAAFAEGLQSWREPQALIDGIESLGPEYERAFQAAVDLRVQEINALRKMPPEVRAVLERQKQQQRQMAQVIAENRRLKTTAQQQEHHAYRAQVQGLLTQHAPRLFKEAQLNFQNPVAKKMFGEHLSAIAGNAAMTLEHVQQAVRATAEELQMQRAAYAAQEQQRRPGGPLPPRAAAASAPPLTVQSQDTGKRGLKAGDFGRRR